MRRRKRKLECFAGPLDGSFVPFVIGEAAGLIACPKDTGCRHHYRLTKDEKHGYYLHYCNEWGERVRASPL